MIAITVRSGGVMVYNLFFRACDYEEGDFMLAADRSKSESFTCCRDKHERR